MTRKTPAETNHHNEFLGTKLEAPPVRSHIVKRTRLTSSLEASLSQQVTLIAAPAGYGKTTLLSEWLSASTSSARKVAWITLDQYDNSPLQFWSYFGAALQRIHPHFDIGSNYSLQRSYEQHNFTWLNSFINKIAQIPHQVCVILDDFHIITDESTLRSLSYLIDHQPRNLHLILSSRISPRIPLSRIRGQGQLLEITARDLAFNLQEEKIFLSSIMQVEMSPDQVVTLLKLTEGWIAGLRLAALSVRGQMDVQQMIANFPQGSHLTFDYLIEEVLNRQNLEIQDFLLKTSILEMLSSPLCDALLERKNNTDIINEIEQANLFITPLDEQKRWYRYHPLFAGALRTMLEKRFSEEEIRGLHQRARAWLLEHDYPDKAVSHALAIGDMESATQIVETCGLDAIINFDLNRLLHWIGSFSDEMIAKRPRLGIYYSIANTILGRFRMVEPMLLMVEQSLCDVQKNQISPEEEKRIRWQISANRATLACIQGNFEEGIPQILALKQDKSQEGSYLYGSMSYRLGESYLSLGDLFAAAAAYQDGIRYASANHGDFDRFHSQLGLAQVRKTQGLLSIAEKEYQETLDIAVENALGAGAIATAHMALTEIHIERMECNGDKPHVLEVLKHLDKIILGSYVWENLVLLYTRLAKYFLAQHNLGDAQSFIDDAVTFYRDYNQTSYHIANDIIDVQVMVWLDTGKLLEGEYLVKELISALDLREQYIPAEQMAYARISLLRQDAASALALLNDLHGRFKGTDHGEVMMKTYILLAQAYQLSQDTQQALDAIGSAVCLAMQENYRWIFAREGQPVKKLLLDYQSSGSSKMEWRQLDRGAIKQYISVLLQSFSEAKAGQSPLPARAQQITRIAPAFGVLSEREIEILTLLCNGKTAKEIAVDLVISINTAKDHIKSVYRKMNVHTRRALIEQTLELRKNGQLE